MSKFRKFMYEVLGWHKGKMTADGFDRVNCVARCKYCGKKVMLDSQGNWFEY